MKLKKTLDTLENKLKKNYSRAFLLFIFDYNCFEGII